MIDNRTTEVGRMSDDDRDRLKHELIGTCQTIDAALDSLALDVSPEVAEDQLLDGAHSVERCAGCAWWFESAVLEVNNAGDAMCDQCWPEGFE